MIRLALVIATSIAACAPAAAQSPLPLLPPPARDSPIGSGCYAPPPPPIAACREPRVMIEDLPLALGRMLEYQQCQHALLMGQLEWARYDLCAIRWELLRARLMGR